MTTLDKANFSQSLPKTLNELVSLHVQAQADVSKTEGLEQEERASERLTAIEDAIVEAPITNLHDLVVKARLSQMFDAGFLGARHTPEGAQGRLSKGLTEAIEKMAGVAPSDCLTACDGQQVIDLLTGLRTTDTAPLPANTGMSEMVSLYVKLWEKRAENASAKGLPPEDERMVRFACGEVKKDLAPFLARVPAEGDDETFSLRSLAERYGKAWTAFDYAATDEAPEEVQAGVDKALEELKAIEEELLQAPIQGLPDLVVKARLVEDCVRVTVSGKLRDDEAHSPGPNAAYWLARTVERLAGVEGVPCITKNGAFRSLDLAAGLLPDNDNGAAFDVANWLKEVEALGCGAYLVNGSERVGFSTSKRPLTPGEREEETRLLNEWRDNMDAIADYLKAEKVA